MRRAGQIAGEAFREVLRRPSLLGGEDERVIEKARTHNRRKSRARVRVVCTCCYVWISMRPYERGGIHCVELNLLSEGHESDQVYAYGGLDVRAARVRVPEARRALPRLPAGCR
jgi:hypothetical protein